MVIVVARFVVMLMPVVFAGLWRTGQLAVEAGRREDFDARARCPRADGDVVLRKKFERPAPDAAGDNEEVRGLTFQHA
jgi:hypothetical protein